ncbi:MAG: electron transport complex subunit E [Lachnospiraceae bacterium]|nr:electron transport complex subunit E [Lachnospiraceae bacterium]
MADTNEKKLTFFGCIFNGIIPENPILVLMIGMCPTLAVTTSVSNAIGMGLSTTAVLVASNALISLVRRITPDRVRIPIYIVIVASFVTLVEFLIKAYFPALYESLGIYIPLIVVNCIIFGRAEAFAGKNNVINSIGDGIGMGLGFTFGIIIISAIRELIGSGSVYGFTFVPENYRAALFVLPPGAFLVLAFLTAIQNKLRLPSATNKKDGCNNDCLHCTLHKETSKVEEGK